MTDKAISSIEVKHRDISSDNLMQVIEMCLPEQGAIEVQHDQPGKEHPWHSHDTDETIILLSGSLKFYWEGGEIICKSGDVINLPKGERHGSIAMDKGAKYIIAFQINVI